MRRKQRYQSEFTGTQEWLVARAPREWPAMIFLLVWLTGWTFGGLFAILALFSGSAGPDEGIFLGVWLCGWTLGWVFAAARLYWQFAGKLRLTVEGGNILYERRVPGFRRVEEYSIAEIERLQPGNRGIELRYDGRSVILFGMLDGAEARAVADWITRRAPLGSFGT